MKESSDMLEKSYLTNREIREVVMYTAEPVSTREATEILLKILDSIYPKAYLQQVANNTTHINAEERTKLIWLLGVFKDLFGGNIGDWYP